MGVVKAINGEELDLSIVENIFQIFPIQVVMYSLLAITLIVWALFIILGVLCA